MQEKGPQRNGTAVVVSYDMWGLEIPMRDEASQQLTLKI